MFDIEYRGGNSIVIASKKTTLIVDPKLSLVGLKDLKVGGAVELATEPRFTVDDDSVQIIIDGPGEYEVGDFTIKGIAATRKTTKRRRLFTESNAAKSRWGFLEILLRD